MIEYLLNFFKKKTTNALQRKINLVFVCHRPQVWGSLNSIFESCNADKDFDITIVAIPNKKQLHRLGFGHEIYETEGAEEFFKDFPCKVINGYDYENKKWFDLRLLKPDYLFYQQPYNICKPKKYRSNKVSKYAKICYVHYATNFIGNGVLEETYPKDFIKNVSLLFMQDKIDADLVKNYLKTFRNKVKTFLTGFPKYDNLEKYANIDSKNWNLPKTADTKRIIWTPRWNTTENNSHFFDYKDELLNYARENKDVDFLFRPHPQTFLELAATGELVESKAIEYKKKYDELDNAKIDTQKEYLTTFYSSDIMIADVSSIIAEYFLTGKPIIYCHKTDCFNDFSRNLSQGFYWVHNWEELKNTLEMLKSGKDPLKEKRQEIIKSNFYFSKNGAGNDIKEIIKNDFYGNNLKAK